MDWLSNFLVLLPAGPIALAERGLLYQAVLFMLIVAVPVFILTFFFAWWYRAKNTKAVYMPDWAHSNMEELIWWAIPLEIILILGALTWSSTHELDPARPLALASGEKPMVIEVVALEWKWLFIYPDERVATVNYVAIPEDRPVTFRITADAPMNSFWIPKLGGQIYAMTGMVTNLNLMASEPGLYDGRSANYSGEGFADMKFVAEAMPQEKFDTWLAQSHRHARALDKHAYETLRKPGTLSEPHYFGMVEQGLFSEIIQTYAR